MYASLQVARAWQSYVDTATGRMYYHNTITKVTTRDRPQCFDAVNNASPPTALRVPQQQASVAEVFFRPTGESRSEEEEEEEEEEEDREYEERLHRRKQLADERGLASEDISLSELSEMEEEEEVERQRAEEAMHRQRARLTVESFGKFRRRGDVHG